MLVTGGHKFAEIGAGGYYTCATTTDGSAWCWGDTLGTGLNIDEEVANTNSPTKLNDGRTYVAISAAYGYWCALDTAANIWCWREFGGQVAVARGAEGGIGWYAGAPQPARVLHLLLCTESSILCKLLQLMPQAQNLLLPTSPS